ncbi:cytoskeletal protein binding protein [Tulasnella sp. 424]|nr:cytoskeletal protein binding protein [Tulasnella sp. 424]
MNRSNLSKLTNTNLAPLDILVVQWDFEARATDELTIKEGDQLYILSDTTDEWVLARRITGPQVDTSKVPSGLVPRPYLKMSPPSSRGSALYEYKAENKNCVNMSLGRKLDVYLIFGKWTLVKLDGFGGRPGGVGYVPGNYVEIFGDDDKEILQPSAFKEPPREV